MHFLFYMNKNQCTKLELSSPSRSSIPLHHKTTKFMKADPTSGSMFKMLK